jgi:hypothetical protein
MEVRLDVLGKEHPDTRLSQNGAAEKSGHAIVVKA